MTRDEMIEKLTSVQASCHVCRWRDEVAALASVIAALRSRPAPPDDLVKTPAAVVADLRREWVRLNFDGEIRRLGSAEDVYNRALGLLSLAPVAAPAPETPAPCSVCGRPYGQCCTTKAETPAPDAMPEIQVGDVVSWIQCVAVEEELDNESLAALMNGRKDLGAIKRNGVVIWRRQAHDDHRGRRRRAHRAGA